MFCVVFTEIVALRMVLGEGSDLKMFRLGIDRRSKTRVCRFEDASAQPRTVSPSCSTQFQLLQNTDTTILYDPCLDIISSRRQSSRKKSQTVVTKLLRITSGVGGLELTRIRVQIYARRSNFAILVIFPPRKMRISLKSSKYYSLLRRLSGTDSGTSKKQGPRCGDLALSNAPQSRGPGQ